MIKNILIFSDLHIGCRFGLCTPPSIYKPKMDEVFELLFETIADVAGNILKQVLENRLDLIEISELLRTLQLGQNQILKELNPEKYEDLVKL